MRSQLPLFSPLYCTYNGFALGVFYAGAQQAFAKPRYRALRQRVHEFLSEIGLEDRWPAQHAHFVIAFNSLFASLPAAVRAQSNELYECFGIGAMAALYAGGASSVTAVQRRALRARWVPVLARHGVSVDQVDEFMRGMVRASPERDAAALFSQAFSLLPHLLQPLAVEADTCFVAMPFKQPYADYFKLYYQPALKQAGFRAMRAWGGLSHEEYYPFIAPLMGRCAAVLAELSTLNLNVVNEVGMAHGLNRPTFLLMSVNERRPPPSNLRDMLILRHDKRQSGWPSQDVRRLARYIRRIWQAYAASMTMEGVIEDCACNLVHYLQSAGRTVPREVRILAGIDVPDSP